MKARALVGCVLAGVAACGGSGPSAAEAQLNIVVQPGEDPAEFETALLVCGAEQVRGTGFLQADAPAACDALERAVVRSVLLDPPPTDRACTELYGGPQQATIIGVLDGDNVEVEISRADGCQIADWTTLLPLIGLATDDPAI